MEASESTSRVEDEAAAGNTGTTDFAGRLCDCGKPAVLKVAGPKSQNRGLRYLCCDAFVFFGKRHNYCRFFEWVDTPRFTREQKEEARVAKRQREKLEASSVVPSLTVATRGAAKQQSRYKSSRDGQVDTRKFDILLEASAVEMNAKINSSQRQCSRLESIIDLDRGNHVCNEHGTADSRDEMVTDADRCNPINEEEPANGVPDLELSIPRTDLQMDVLQVETDNKTSGCKDAPSEVLLVSDVQECEPRQNDVATNVELVMQRTEHGANEQSVERIDKTSEAKCNQSADNDSESLSAEVPFCLCSRAAVLKTVKSKGPNLGLRYWVCSNSRPFYMKKQKHKKGVHGDETSCKFFRWLDTPSKDLNAQREEKKQKRKEFQKRRELALLSFQRLKFSNCLKMRIAVKLTSSTVLFTWLHMRSGVVVSPIIPSCAIGKARVRIHDSVMLVCGFHLCQLEEKLAARDI